MDEPLRVGTSTKEQVQILHLYQAQVANNKQAIFHPATARKQRAASGTVALQMVELLEVQARSKN